LSITHMKQIIGALLVFATASAIGNAASPHQQAHSSMPHFLIGCVFRTSCFCPPVTRTSRTPVGLSFFTYTVGHCVATMSSSYARWDCRTNWKVSQIFLSWSFRHSVL